MIWEPDTNILESARAGSLRAKEMDVCERAWVVAALAHEGETAEATASMLHCSLRLIRQIRSEPMAAMARYVLDKTDEHDRAERRYKAEIRTLRFTTFELSSNAERYKDQRDQLLEQRQALASA